MLVLFCKCGVNGELACSFAGVGGRRLSSFGLAAVSCTSSCMHLYYYNISNVYGCVFSVPSSYFFLHASTWWCIECLLEILPYTATLVNMVTANVTGSIRSLKPCKKLSDHWYNARLIFQSQPCSYTNHFSTLADSWLENNFGISVAQTVSNK